MFGVGYQEMFILVVAALVIFGPGNLPEVAGQLGRLVRDFRRMTADLTGEFEKTIAEVDDVKRSVRREVKSMRSEVEGVSQSVKADLESAGGSSNSAHKPTGTTARAGAGTDAARTAKAEAANRATGTLPVATKADPLADVSFLDEEALVPANGRPAPSGIADGGPNGTASVGEGGTNGASADGGGNEDDALARVRRRRAAAGYNRRS